MLIKLYSENGKVVPAENVPITYPTSENVLSEKMYGKQSGFPFSACGE
jgi:hypothetical protein